tara:strand:- start:1040 stop:2677 length:1638 start_codon:yes stop_codon:yes gene_type:complete
MPDLFILFVFYFLIVFSVFGYGKLISNVVKENYDVGFQGLTGLSFLIILSYLTNFFVKHDYYHNSIIISFGFIVFLLYLLKYPKKVFQEVKILIIIFSIIFFGLLMYKNHDDFFYYHFPYTLTIVEYKKILGIGNLNHGFRTPSSIFYINSIFYLPFVKYFLMNVAAALFMGFSNIFLIKKIKEYINEKNQYHLLFISLLSFVYINTQFARISEHGTDRSALILLFILVILFLESFSFLNKKNLNQKIETSYRKILIILFLICSLKAFYLLYGLLFLLWIINIIKKNKNINLIFNIILLNKITYFFLFGVLLVLLNVYLNTGCVVYPAYLTCFGDFEWSIPVDQVKQMKIWYEQWSKAGAGPNYSVENVSLYLSNFNWVKNWFDKYFFTKVSDALLVILLIIIIFYFTFRSKQKIITTNSDYIIIYIGILALSLEWFINHPALRYGGYSLIALIFFIPLSIYLSKFSYSFKQIKLKTSILILISLTFFLTKNLNRIYTEHDKYNYNVFAKPFYNLSKDAFRISTQLKKLDLDKNIKIFKYNIVKK